MVSPSSVVEIRIQGMILDSSSPLYLVSHQALGVLSPKHVRSSHYFVSLPSLFLQTPKWCVYLRFSCLSIHSPLCGHSDFSEMKIWSSYSLAKILDWFLKALLVKTKLFYYSQLHALCFSYIGLLSLLEYLLLWSLLHRLFFSGILFLSFFLILLYPSHSQPLLLPDLVLFIHTRDLCLA